MRARPGALRNATVGHAQLVDDATVSASTAAT